MNEDQDLLANPNSSNAMLADVAVIHTETSICDELNRKYAGNCKYKLANGFIFKWESDFFVQKDNGYSYEFEVKISRSDYFSDKNKIEKHLILDKGIFRQRKSKGVYNSELKITEWEEWYEESKWDFRPNKFFYVVHKDLISVSEVPGYAGLMYVGESGIYTVKEAPFIHKDKLKFEGVLCNKFYHYWLNAKQRIKELEIDVKSLTEQSDSNIS